MESWQICSELFRILQGSSVQHLTDAKLSNLSIQKRRKKRNSWRRIYGKVTIPLMSNQIHDIVWVFLGTYNNFVHRTCDNCCWQMIPAFAEWVVNEDDKNGSFLVHLFSMWSILLSWEWKTNVWEHHVVETRRFQTA